MSTFKEIRGQLIKKYTTNPTDPLEGQMWYNSTTGTLKGVVVTAAWSSASPTITARATGAGFGTQTAAVMAGGAPYTTATEEYNGSGWSAGGALNTARRSNGGLGIITAGLSMGGYAGPPTNADINSSEEYDGSSWTATNNLNTARAGMGSFGTTSAGVIGGGSVGPTAKSEVEEYNGTSWSEETNITTARYGLMGAGTLAAGVVFGGNLGPPGMSNATEEYDGTNWTAGGNINTARGELSGGGDQTATIAMAGRTTGPSPGSTATETYDGTTWTTSPATLATAQAGGLGGPVGTSTASLFAGGRTGPAMTPPIVATTQEFNRGIYVISPVGAWAAGGNLPQAQYGQGASQSGTQDAGLAFGGDPTRTLSCEYGGTSWTATPSLNTGRAYLSGFGTSTAAVAAGGHMPAASAATEEYNGASWSSNPSPSGDLNTARWSLATAGILTAGVAMGGTPPYSSATEEYNGSTWTTVTAMPQANQEMCGGGTQTASVFAGGGPPSADARLTLEYNGTGWTVGGSCVTDHKKGGLIGDVSDAIIAGGHTSPQTNTERYDGTAWGTVPQISTARGRMANVGTTTAGFVAGGNPSSTNATEEWTATAPAINIQTVTTS